MLSKIMGHTNVYDTANDKVVMAGGDSDGRLAVFVGTVAGETITFGSKQEAGDDPLVDNIALVYDPDTSKAVVAYRDRQLQLRASPES